MGFNLEAIIWALVCISDLLQSKLDRKMIKDKTVFPFHKGIRDKAKNYLTFNIRHSMFANMFTRTLS
jgi:hypothetical protein